ncbi:hypothetical protein [Pseudomonas sp. MNR3A]|uniref:hypothetical protein n=1 Tax=Pseudomonas sp. MNR3A TaxID=2615213 RepID=UPI00129B1384|nr:hypothetical protein [Pseudomonas sp. MNR3A]
MNAELLTADHWLIPCKNKEKLDLEDAMRDIHDPRGVSSFITKVTPQAVQLRMPTVEEIKSEPAQRHGEPPSND